jgi:hypothetical protein
MMDEERNCKDCLYYKELTKPILRQTIGTNKSLEMLRESKCKAHEERYSSNCEWHPVKINCFTPKEGNI